MNKYAGKHPKLVPNRNLGFMNKPVIEIGLDQTFGKSAIYNQGGGGPAVAQPAVYGTVYGGNGIPITGTTESNFTYGTTPNMNLIFGLSRTESIVSPDDWSLFVLPKEFEHGDEPRFYDGATEVFLPQGVGLLRLSRGSGAVGTSSWNADLDVYGSTDTVSGNTSIVVAQVRQGTELHVYYDTVVDPLSAIVTGNQAELNTYFDFTTTPIPVPIETIEDRTILIESYVGYGSAQNILVFSLTNASSASTDIAWDDIIQLDVTISPMALNQNADEPQNVFTDTVIFSEARNCYIQVANLAYGKTVSRGDFMMLISSTQITIPDAQDPIVNKTLRYIQPGDSTSFHVHRHLNDAPTNQGGGAAFPTMLPPTKLGFNALGILPA